MLERIIRDGDSFISIYDQDGLKRTEIVPVEEANDEIKALFGIQSDADWDGWRQEILQSPTFLWLVSHLNNGAANLFATLQNLLFNVSRDPSLIPQISALWEIISDQANIFPETKESLAAIAESHNLPSEFVAAIRGTLSPE
jgi:hypothetical protein